MEMITDDKRDMRKLLQELCSSWISIGERLLKMDLNYIGASEAKPGKQHLKDDGPSKSEIQSEMKSNPVLNNLKNERRGGLSAKVLRNPNGYLPRTD
jgi:hypothetical protein